MTAKVQLLFLILSSIILGTKGQAPQVGSIAKNAASDVAAEITEDVKRAFQQFMGTYNISYSDKERPVRQQIFADNLRRIEQLKAQGAKGIGINGLAATSPEEFKSMLISPEFVKNNPPLTSGGQEPPANRAKRQSMPTSFDYRTYSWVSSVKNQGSCGSCWAHAADALLETAYLRKYGWNSAYNYDLSEQDLIDCTTSPNNGCTGGWVNVALDYVNSRYTTQEYYYPNAYYKGTCKAVTRNIAGASYYIFTNENDIQYYNYYYGAVAFYFNVPSAFQYYDGRTVFDVPDCSAGSTSGLHEMVIIGYTPDYWHVKNSWGTSWGAQGFVYWKRGKNLCNMQAQLILAYK